MTGNLNPLHDHQNNHDRPYDLPPSWDGVPVTWGQWTKHRTTLAYHLPAEALACEQCGSVDERAVNWGTRPPAAEADNRGPFHPLRDLCALRCRHCGHDQVLDERTDETWDLGPEDYTAEGSTPIETLF